MLKLRRQNKSKNQGKFEGEPRGQRTHMLGCATVCMKSGVAEDEADKVCRGLSIWAPLQAVEIWLELFSGRSLKYCQNVSWYE